MVRATIQVGNLMSMVTNDEWWRIKKRYLNLLLDRGDKNKKGKRTLKGVFGVRVCLLVKARAPKSWDS
jgi:hypothetical protein